MDLVTGVRGLRKAWNITYLEYLNYCEGICIDNGEIEYKLCEDADSGHAEQGDGFLGSIQGTSFLNRWVVLVILQRTHCKQFVTSHNRRQQISTTDSQAPKTNEISNLRTQIYFSLSSPENL
jgi:hypothetical protein